MYNSAKSMSTDRISVILIVCLSESDDNPVKTKRNSQICVNTVNKNKFVVIYLAFNIKRMVEQIYLISCIQPQKQHITFCLTQYLNHGKIKEQA